MLDMADQVEIEFRYRFVFNKSKGEIIDMKKLDKVQALLLKNVIQYEFKNETFHATYWIPETLKGAVILNHGYGEYFFFGK